MPVMGIVSQGRNPATCCNQFVRSYDIHVSNDNAKWVYMGRFKGNTDTMSKVYNVFTGQVSAQYVRVTVVSVNEHASMRWDVLLTACKGGQPTQFSISPPVANGLSFSTSTGMLSGKPTASAVTTTYTVTPSSAAGAGTPFTFTVAVTDMPITDCAYVPSAVTVKRDMPLTSNGVVGYTRANAKLSQYIFPTGIYGSDSPGPCTKYYVRCVLRKMAISS